MEKSIGRAPEELRNQPPFPDHLNYLWGHYVALKNASGGVIGFDQIRAYADLTGEVLAPWEVEAVRAIDDAHSQEQAKAWQKK